MSDPVSYQKRITELEAEVGRLREAMEAADERLMDTLEVTSGWHSRLGPFKGRDDESWNAVSKSAEDALNILRAALSQPPQEETGRELNARLARDFDRERDRRLAQGQK